MEEGDDQVEEEIEFWGEGSIWQNIPDDLIIYIFSFLDCNSLLEASKTCAVSKIIMQCRGVKKLLSTENVRFFCHFQCLIFMSSSCVRYGPGTEYK